MPLVTWWRTDYRDRLLGCWWVTCVKCGYYFDKAAQKNLRACPDCGHTAAAEKAYRAAKEGTQHG